jgi:hypothetical protein
VQRSINAVISFNVTWESSDTLSFSVRSQKWVETRIQTAFHTIFPQSS